MGSDGTLTVRNDGRAPVRFLPDGWPHKDAATGLETFASTDGSHGFVCRMSRGDVNVLDIEASFSEDGKSLTERITERHQNRVTYASAVDYTRVSGRDSFVGRWQARNPYMDHPPRVFFAAVKPNGSFWLSLPSGGRFLDVRPGGPAASIMGIKVPTTQMAALTLEDHNTLHWTKGSYQKMVIAGTAVLSSEGRTLRIEGWPLNQPEARSVVVYARRP